MPRGRFINKTISYSQKLAALPDDTARLVATWIIPHLDKNGVFYGEAAMVKGLVLPLIHSVSVEQVNAALQAMSAVGLIELFADGGRTWQCWRGFADNQKGMHPDRESTEYPAPPDNSGNKPEHSGETPANSGKQPEYSGKQPAKEKVEVEDKDTLSQPPAPESDTKPEDARAIYEQVFADQLKTSPNAQQISLLAQVSDLQKWRIVLEDWKAHKWRHDNVPGMVDKYNAKPRQPNPRFIAAPNWPRKSSRREQVPDSTDEQREAAREAARKRIEERAARKANSQEAA